MPAPSLLSIEPDKLFEESSILEIEEVQRRVQNEIDRKREELRTMVGERYRDLIEAADTISEMKMISEKVINDVQIMKEITAKLQDSQVSGFKIDSTRNVKVNPWACIASLIKLFIDVTEHIWEAVDSCNFTNAALLFLMARHIKTSLEINQNFQTSQYFPVVSRQWSSIVHFKDTILQGAETSLKSQHKSQVTCDGLLSLALLEGLAADQLLDRYLGLRSEALRSALDHRSVDSGAVKRRLCDSYTLLVHTVASVSHCFLGSESQDGSLWKEIKNYLGPNSRPIIQLIDAPGHFLPPAITEFRPELDRPMVPLDAAKVNEALSSWLVWVRSLIRDQGSLLLQKLSSLRSLQGLRDPPPVSEEWPGGELVLPADLWSELYRSLVTQRAQQLVSVHWDAALKTLQLQLQDATTATALETKHSEVDLHRYMWKEETNEAINSVNDRNKNKGLWLKSRGVTRRVSELCAALEHRLRSLLGDLGALCPDQPEVEPALLAISHTLRAHQQTTCARLLQKLVEFVMSLVREDTIGESVVMMLAKYLQSIPELCPSLQKCLSSVDTKTGSWQECNALLQTECLTAYKKWLSLASIRVLKHITDIVGGAVPDLNSIPQWDEISIEEEGESGEKLQSVLKVPCSPSQNLQRALYHTSSVTSHAAVPKQVSEQLMDVVVHFVIKLYNTNSGNELTQTQLLQMLLDVKYLAQLFSSFNNKELKVLCQETISNLESKIDPFDLNVFLPYINTHVKTSVHRTQALVGVTVSAGNAVNSHRTDEPCVLALSSSAAPWFPLLHITAPKANLPPSRPKGKKALNSSSVPNSLTESAAKQSTTSSFFGAMASDWFG